MKKIIVSFFTLILIFLSACNEKNPGDPAGNTVSETTVMEGEVIEINNGIMLLAGVGPQSHSSDLYSVTADLRFDAGGSNIQTEDIGVGMKIEVGYDGYIMESYPLQLGNPEFYRIIEEGDGLITMYLEVLEDLYNNDKALNEDITMMAFDFSKAGNLTAAEKSGISYIMGNRYNLEELQGTFEELSSKGYINEENLYFEHGILFKIEVTKESKNKLNFTASKWRSGTGANGMESKAKKKNGTWTYKTGLMWVS